MNEQKNNSNPESTNGFSNENVNGHSAPTPNGQSDNYMNGQAHPNMSGQPIPNMYGQPNPNMNGQPIPNINGQPIMNSAPMPGNGPKKNNNMVKALIIGIIILLFICIGLTVLVVLTVFNKDEDAHSNEVTTEEVIEDEEESVSETEEASTEETSTEPETTEVETEEASLSVTRTSNADIETAELSDFVFSLDDVTYALPISYKDFSDAGWSISSNSLTEDDMIAANNYEMPRMTNGAVEIYTYVFNASGNTKAIKDCKIGGFQITARNNLDFCIAKGITCLSTPDEITEAFGTPTSSTTYDDYTSLRYDIESDARRAKVSFIIYKDKTTNNSIDIMYFAATEDDETEISTERPEYLDTYTAPSKLSDDVFDTMFELDGDLYQLPCPLSEFTDNGWTVASKDSDSLDSNNRSSYCLKLQKGDNSVYLDMCNFAMTSQLIENCAVSGIEFEAYYLKDITPDFVNMPGGLNLGSSADEVETACPNFEKYEGSSSVSYTYSVYSGGQSEIKYYFGSGLNPTPTISLENMVWDY